MARYVKVPLIATHSSCRKFTPGFERNVSDEIIKEIACTKGVVMITFGFTFVDGDIASEFRARRQKYQELLKSKDIAKGSEEEKAIKKQFDLNFPPSFADVSKIVDYIDHVVKLVGVDYVGSGSYFDGVGDSLPNGLKDVSDYPNIIYHLLQRAYLKDIQKLIKQQIPVVNNHDFEDTTGSFQPAAVSNVAQPKGQRPPFKKSFPKKSWNKNSNRERSQAS